MWSKNLLLTRVTTPVTGLSSLRTEYYLWSLLNAGIYVGFPCSMPNQLIRWKSKLKPPSLQKNSSFLTTTYIITICTYICIVNRRILLWVINQPCLEEIYIYLHAYKTIHKFTQQKTMNGRVKSSKFPQILILWYPWIVRRWPPSRRALTTSGANAGWPHGHPTHGCPVSVVNVFHRQQLGIDCAVVPNLLNIQEITNRTHWTEPEDLTALGTYLGVRW